MNGKVIIKRVMLVQSVLLITACGHSNPFADIQEFMQQVDNKPLPDIVLLPEFEPYQSFTYSASKRRSPFLASVSLPKETAKQWRNGEIKPPESHIRQLLEDFPLSSLQMVGTFKKADATWALVVDTQGRIHGVSVGDYMGQHGGEIDRIDDTSIDVIEMFSDGAGGWLLKSSTLELKGLQQ